MADRPRPLNSDASLQERLRHLELTIFGDPDDVPEPAYIDTTARDVTDIQIVRPSTSGIISELERMRAMLRQHGIDPDRSD